jgi:hypothetical protein
MEDEGLIAQKMRELFGPSWKTSVAGIVTLACAVIAGINQAHPGVIPPMLVTLGAIVGPLAAGGGLLVAKDGDVTGGTRKHGEVAE